MALDITLGNRHGHLISSAVLSSMPISMACWGRVTLAAANLYTLISIVNPTDNKENLQMQMDGTLSGDPVTANTQDGGSRARGFSDTGYTVGKWHHCGAIFTGSGANCTGRRAFIDGVGGSIESTSHTPSGLGRTVVGIELGLTATEQMVGHVVAPAIWDTILSDSDFEKLALGWRPAQIKRSNLIVAPDFRSTDIPVELTVIDPISGDTWTENSLGIPVFTGGSWSAGVATLGLIIPLSNSEVGMHMSVSAVTPSGYNGTKLEIVAISGNDYSYALANDPGSYTSGGSVVLRVPRSHNPGPIVPPLRNRTNLHRVGRRRHRR